MSVRAGRRAFTLVEVLVATAILGIVLAALLALVSGTTTFTARSTSASDAVRDLSDASGYLGDAFRSAASVRPTSTFNLDGGGTVTCAPDTCLAFDVPTFDANGDRGDDLLNVYVVVDRSSLQPEWRVDPPYDPDPAVTPEAIVRYVATAPGVDELEALPSLLLDNVVEGSARLDFDAADGSLRIEIQTARRDRTGTSSYPGNGPLVTTVFRRN